MDDSILDYPSHSDTESSLSRSSSLIQFESLERQLLQNDLVVGTTPTTAVLDQAFERFIPLQQQQQQQQLHFAPVTVSIQTKTYTTPATTASSLNNKSSIVNDKHQQIIVPNSSLSTFSNRATFTAVAGNGTEGVVVGDSSILRFRGKNSQEELSEDSGYCDHSQLQSIGSDELFGENCKLLHSSTDELLDGGEEEEADECMLMVMRRRIHPEQEDKLKIVTEEYLLNSYNDEGEDDDDDWAAAAVGAMEEEEHEQLQMMRQFDGARGEEMEVDINNKRNSPPTATRNNNKKKSISYGGGAGGVRRKVLLGRCQRIASRSLPNIFLNQTQTEVVVGDGDTVKTSAAAAFGSQRRDSRGDSAVIKKDQLPEVKVNSNVDDDDDEEELGDEFLKVNSFPEGLNYLLSGCAGSYSDDDQGDGEGDYEECQEFFSNEYYYDGVVTSGECGGTISSKNLDLHDFISSPSRGGSASLLFHSTPDQQSRAGVLTASYSNLTALDYSQTSPSKLFLKMDNGKRSGSGGRPTIANPEITLMDEISFNFDKNLSIINDRCGNFEPLIEDEDGEVEEAKEEAAAVLGILNIRRPPKPPPRRFQRKGGRLKSDSHSMENLQVPMQSQEVLSKMSSESLTFDRDPTNLTTCYAASLERCNFETMDQPVMTMMSTFNRNVSACSLQQPETMLLKEGNSGKNIICKEMVVSTPNLSLRDPRQMLCGKEMCADNKAQTIANVYSRNSLYKEVSFHPIVAEISWRQEDEDDDDDEDDMEPDSLSEDSLNGEEDKRVCESAVDSELEDDVEKEEEEDDDYFGLKRDEHFKDLDLTDHGKQEKERVVAAAEPVTITIRKTIILTPKVSVERRCDNVLVEINWVKLKTVS